MSNTSWMQPALQPNEAVLLPALERSIPSPVRRTHSRRLSAPPADVFVPVAEPVSAAPFTRPAGSIAGRSILRAAGISAAPVCHRRKKC